MDQIAIISDVHGNLPALETVLADIRQRGIDTIYCLGDLVGKGPDSVQAVDICRAVCQAVVVGNWDDRMAHGPDRPSRRWHRERLGPERLTYLGNLPHTIDFQMSGKQVRLFHASAQSEHYRITFRHELPQLRAMFDNTAFTTFDHPKPNVVGYGDIHHAYMLPVDDKLLFNVGSVGNPLDYIPLTGYAILKGNLNSPLLGPLAVEIVRLPYDIELAIAQARVVNMPKLAAYEFELRTANHRSQMARKQAPIDLL